MRVWNLTTSKLGSTTLIPWQGQVYVHASEDVQSQNPRLAHQNVALSAPRLPFPFFSITSYTAMAQIRGTAGYHLGNQSPFGNAGRSDDTRDDPSPLDQLRVQTSKIEDMLDTLADPIKP